MLRNTSIATIDSPEFIQVTPHNDLISECEIKVLYLGENRNRSFISKETAKEMANSLPCSPIVAKYVEKKEDFSDHGEVIVVEDGEVSVSRKTVPYGFVAPDAEIWFQKFIDIDEDGVETEREYLMTTGYLWTGRYPEIQQVLTEGLPQSMELDEKSLDGHWAKNNNSNYEFFIINDATFSGLCVLGSDVEPCFEGASVTARTSFSAKEQTPEFIASLLEMRNELYALQNEGGSDMLIENQEVEAEFEAAETIENEAPVVEFEEAAGGESSADSAGESTDSSDTSEGEVSDGEGETSEGETSEDNQEQEETTDEPAADDEPSNEDETSEEEPAEGEESENEEQEPIVPEPDEEQETPDPEIPEEIELINTDVSNRRRPDEFVKEEDEESAEESEEEKPSADHSLEEVEAEFATVKAEFEALKADYAALQEKFDTASVELESLREFKLGIENQRKEQEIAKYSMFINADALANIRENMAEFSLDEIKSKLAVLYVENNVNFSLDDTEEVIEQEEEEGAITTFSLDTPVDMAFVPEWVQALHDAKN